MYYDDKELSKEHYFENKEKIDEWLRRTDMTKKEIKDLAKFLGISYEVLKLKLLLKGDKDGR